MKTRNLILLLLSSLIASCTGSYYMESRNINPLGWDKDSLLAYSFVVPDTVENYDILLHLRHLDNYPYQNMWLFLGETDSLITDTIEFYLADDRGMWLGNRGNGHISMSVLYESSIRFEQLGERHLYIRHGMRRALLPGVSDLSVEVKRTK
ncbi:MAG: gliding motility lipoprotein GldH [Paludibacteraceae bacterium]|nr:gliding motility lipoprotein GldH [Paludibacteraceae bacterium]